MVFIVNIPRNAVERNIGSLLKKTTLIYGKEEKKVSITVSAGVFLVSEPGCDFEKLYQKADEALYQVKHGAKNGYKICE